MYFFLLWTTSYALPWRLHSSQNDLRIFTDATFNDQPLLPLLSVLPLASNTPPRNTYYYINISLPLEQGVYSI